jgi:hypothetical protein
MSLKRPDEIRKKNVLGIISFALAVLMLIIFFLPALFPAVADIKVGEFFFVNYCYVAMIPLGLAGLVAGIIALVQIKKNHERGLWMSIIGITIDAIGTVFMFLVVRLLIILSHSF